MNRIGQRRIVRSQGDLLQPFDDGHRIGVLPVGQMGSKQALNAPENDVRRPRSTVAEEEIEHRAGHLAIQRIVGDGIDAIAQLSDASLHPGRNFRNMHAHFAEKGAMILRIESIDIFLAEEMHQVGDLHGRRRFRLAGRLVDGHQHLHQPDGVIGELGHRGQVSQRLQDFVLRHGRGEITQKRRPSRIGGQRAQNRSHDHSAHRIGQ